MLVILYGPSCIGKTSIQRGLIDTSSKIKAVRCFQTRIPRECDIGRVQVDNKQYQGLLLNNELAISNEHFGNYYGTSKVDLEDSIVSNEIYTLDWLIKDRKLLASYAHKKILVMPDSLEQVLIQMNKAGRDERKAVIIEGYTLHYSPSHVEKLKSDGFFVLRNRYNKLTESITEILEYLK